MTNFNERRTYFFIKIYLSHFIRKGWCWLCVTGELETGTDSYILTQSSSNHSINSFSSWQGCSTRGHWELKALCQPLALNSASCPQLTPTATATDSNWPKPSVAPGYIIVLGPPNSCGRTHLPQSPNSTTSTGQGDIPISLTGCTCFRCSFPYLRRCISWLTVRSRVNMLHHSFGRIPGCAYITRSYSQISISGTVRSGSPFPTPSLFLPYTLFVLACYICLLCVWSFRLYHHMNYTCYFVAYY